MNFCSCGVIFILLEKLKGNTNLKNAAIFVRSHMVDFRRPGHMLSCSDVYGYPGLFPAYIANPSCRDYTY